MKLLVLRGVLTLFLVVTVILTGCKDVDSVDEQSGDSDSNVINNSDDSDSNNDDTNVRDDSDVIVGDPEPTGYFDGLEILVVVDNSHSMTVAQNSLSTSLYSLINSFQNPIEGSSIAQIDSVRVAIVSSDMGLQWGENPYDYSDGFPTGMIGEKCADPSGDNGVFIDDYDINLGHSGNATVDIQEGVIKCDVHGSQCPTNWTCENIDASSGIGTCEDIQGDGTAQACPDSPASFANKFISLDDNAWTSKELPFASVCLANLGIMGCGIEQQLSAAKVAMKNDGQTTGFIRENSLTLLMVVSDEEDCSLEDGPSFYATDEIQENQGTKVNIACGKNSEYLYKVSEIKESLEASKGRKGALFFTAIVGVPPVDACQGKGADITGCLDVELPDGNGTMGAPGTVVRKMGGVGAEATYYSYACERYTNSGDAAVLAYPGTRFVQMAQSFGHMGYVFSICNEDWSAAMDDIAGIVSKYIDGK